jgi:quercetin dioxygenase-like cupin family protein
MFSRLRTTVAAVALISSSILASSTAIADETITPLLKQALPDNMEANVLSIEVEPGYQTERHLHPGHVFVYVLEGAVDLVVDGEEPVRLSAGEAAYETPNKPMVGRNVSSTEGARLIVFQVGEAGKPLQIAQPQ